VTTWRCWQPGGVYTGRPWRAHLSRARVTLRRQGISADRIADAVRMYGEGWSCQRLAERFHCDDETVRKSLKEAGVTLRRPWER
jgi:hypothetical protein